MCCESFHIPDIVLLKILFHIFKQKLQHFLFILYKHLKKKWQTKNVSNPNTYIVNPGDMNLLLNTHISF